MDLGIQKPKKGTDLLKTGEKEIKITIIGKGGDKGKRAIFTLKLRWFLTASVKDVIEFIHGEIKKNLESPVFKQIKKGFSKPFSPISAANSLKIFAQQVGQNRPWDYKIKIKDTFNVWSLDAPRGIRYQHDLWGNLHYGYIGKAAGIPEDLLLQGAGGPFDEKKDWVAIKIGINLWNLFGKNVTKGDILRKVRFFRLVLAAEKAPEGKPPKSMRED